jgi:hypothetical protein
MHARRGAEEVGLWDEEEDRRRRKKTCSDAKLAQSTRETLEFGQPPTRAEVFWSQLTRDFFLVDLVPFGEIWLNFTVNP